MKERAEKNLLHNDSIYPNFIHFNLNRNTNKIWINR